MEIQIPECFHEKTLAFPESSYGANKVTLVFNDGSRVQHVILAWGTTIVKIKEKKIEKADDLPFKTEDISDVVSEI